VIEKETFATPRYRIILHAGALTRPRYLWESRIVGTIKAFPRTYDLPDPLDMRVGWMHEVTEDTGA
jgi:hypothetical protein